MAQRILLYVLGYEESQSGPEELSDAVGLLNLADFPAPSAALQLAQGHMKLDLPGARNLEHHVRGAKDRVTYGCAVTVLGAVLGQLGEFFSDASLEQAVTELCAGVHEWLDWSTNHPQTPAARGTATPASPVAQVRSLQAALEAIAEAVKSRAFALRFMARSELGTLRVILSKCHEVRALYLAVLALWHLSFSRAGRAMIAQEGLPAHIAALIRTDGIPKVVRVAVACLRNLCMPLPSAQIGIADLEYLKDVLGVTQWSAALTHGLYDQYEGEQGSSFPDEDLLGSDSGGGETAAPPAAPADQRAELDSLSMFELVGFVESGLQDTLPSILAKAGDPSALPSVGAGSASVGGGQSSVHSAGGLGPVTPQPTMEVASSDITWQDPELLENGHVLLEALRNASRHASSAERLYSALASFKLRPSLLHEAEWWAANVKAVNAHQFKLLKLLAKVLDPAKSDAVTLRCACDDVGHVALTHPNGRTLCATLGLKSAVAVLVAHDDPAVSRAALRAMSKLLTHKWEWSAAVTPAPGTPAAGT